MHPFFITLLLAAGPEVDTRLAVPPARLDGVWKLLAGEQDGVALPARTLADYTLTIRDQRALVECRCEGLVAAGQFDLFLERDTFRTGGWYQGRYRLEKGLLLLWVTDSSTSAHFVLYPAAR